MKYLDDYDYEKDRPAETPEKPRRHAGGYVSPLWPPPGSPFAAHGTGCPSDCPCRKPGARRGKAGLRLITEDADGTKNGEGGAP